MKNCLLQVFEDEKMITQRKVMILLKMFKHVCDAIEYEKYHVRSPSFQIQNALKEIKLTAFTALLRSFSDWNV